MELVSVIIPAFNAQEYIQECIHSLLSQTYKDLEILIVDDGSTDHTADKCIELSEQDERIHYHKQVNSGVSVARNTGLSLAHGQYVIFVDADDELHPSMIEKLVYDAEQSNADISVCDIKKISSPEEKAGGEKEPAIELYDQDDALSLYMTCNYFEIGVWNKLFKKNILESVRFVEGRRMNEDKFFIFENLMKATRVCYRKEPLYYYYVRPQSATKRQFDDRWFDNRYFAQQIYKRISEEKTHLEVAARTQYLLSLYYLVLVMKRNAAEDDYGEEYRSIVDEIREIPLKDLKINSKTKFGIILLRRFECVFDLLKSK